MVASVVCLKSYVFLISVVDNMLWLAYGYYSNMQPSPCISTQARGQMEWVELVPSQNAKAEAPHFPQKKANCQGYLRRCVDEMWEKYSVQIFPVLFLEYIVMHVGVDLCPTLYFHSETKKNEHEQGKAWWRDRVINLLVFHSYNEDHCTQTIRLHFEAWNILNNFRNMHDTFNTISTWWRFLTPEVTSKESTIH